MDELQRHERVQERGDNMTKREFLDTVFTLAPNEANAIMDAFDEYVESNVVPTGRSGKERRMSKYIIEIPDGVPYVLLRREDFGITKVVPVADLEELNSDYINEHYGSLQDGAFDRGLTEAWELARAIWHDECGERSKLGCVSIQGVFDKYTAQEAIAKLKAYKDKQKEDDPIKVGDEVTHKSDLAVWKAVCIRIDGDRQHMNLMGHTGAVGYYPVDDFKKTGRHFDISSILEELRNG